MCVGEGQTRRQKEVTCENLFWLDADRTRDTVWRGTVSFEAIWAGKISRKVKTEQAILNNGKLLYSEESWTAFKNSLMFLSSSENETTLNFLHHNDTFKDNAIDSFKLAVVETEGQDIDKKEKAVVVRDTNAECAKEYADTCLMGED